MKIPLVKKGDELLPKRRERDTESRRGERNPYQNSRPFIVEVLKLPKCQDIPVSKLGQINDSLFGGFIVNNRVNFLHFSVGINAVIVDDHCPLNVGIAQVIPFDVRVFLFFLDYSCSVSGPLFFSCSNSSSALS